MGVVLNSARARSLCAAALAGAFACTAPPQDDAPAQAGRVPLTGTAWQLVAFQSMDDTRLVPEGDSTYTIEFADSAVAVRSDCNRGRGSWQSPDTVSLLIERVAMTRAQCPPSPLTDRFVRDLEYVRSYVVRDGRLHLALMADGGIYEFERRNPEP